MKERTVSEGDRWVPWRKEVYDDATGAFSVRGSYQVVLTDETGEPRGTRAVVVNAIRLALAATGL